MRFLQGGAGKLMSAHAQMHTPAPHKLRHDPLRSRQLLPHNSADVLPFLVSFKVASSNAAPRLSLRVTVADYDELAAGTIIQVRPQLPPLPSTQPPTNVTNPSVGAAVDTAVETGTCAAGTDASDGNAQPYHAQVIDLPMFLATERPRDVRALQYTYVPHLQRFDQRPTGTGAEGHERGGDGAAGMGSLQEKYGQREFVKLFYPQLDTGAMDFFDTSTNSDLWLLAVAVNSKGEQVWWCAHKSRARCVHSGRA